MTYFYKVVKIDLDFERERVKRIRYPKGAKKALYALYDAVARHDLGVAFRMIRKWPDEWHEFICEQVWNLLWDLDNGGYRSVGRVELEGYWKKRDRKKLPT